MTRIEIIKDANMNDLFDAMGSVSRFELFCNMLKDGWNINRYHYAFVKKIGKFRIAISFSDACYGAPVRMEYTDPECERCYLETEIHINSRLQYFEIEKYIRQDIAYIRSKLKKNPNYEFEKRIA